MNRGERRYLGKTEVFDITGGGEAGRHVSELDIEQLLGVQRAMVVGSRCDGSGDTRTSCVDSLPAIIAIYTTGDFLDDDGGETLAADLLVDA